jgi:Zn finger protein HypA/HybF involved in hydrogenase expression
MDKHEVYCDECGDINISRDEHWAIETGQHDPLFCPFCGSDIDIIEDEDEDEYE